MVETVSVRAEKDTWTGKVRERTVEAFPPETLLPDQQPAYVASWIYVFGALTLGAFVVVMLSGAVLALEGPAWWHKSNAGLFVNSMHLWSTEFFFMFMVIHLWGKFFMAAWRGRRRMTWITGVLAFAISIATAFTGYLSQQNFDSEWIGTQAKDGINATGAGAFWNVLNFGQMLMWHIVLLPLVVVIIIGIHVLQVRRHGVVPPFAPTEAQLAKAGLSQATPASSIVFGDGASPPSADLPVDLGAPVQGDLGSPLRHEVPEAAAAPTAAPPPTAAPQSPPAETPTAAPAQDEPPAELWRLPEDQS